MGWFYCFKLQIVINDEGEILNFDITRNYYDLLILIAYIESINACS